MAISRDVPAWVLLLLVAAPVIAQRPDDVDQTGKVKYTKDTLQTVKDLVARKKAVVVDVRTKAEWDQVHLKTAFFIPTQVIRNPARCAAAVKQLDKEKVVYVHCQRGARAKVCADVLRQLGYDARPLKVNYEEWGKAGFEEVVGRKVMTGK